MSLCLDMDVELDTNINTDSYNWNNRVTASNTSSCGSSCLYHPLHEQRKDIGFSSHELIPAQHHLVLHIAALYLQPLLWVDEISHTHEDAGCCNMTIIEFIKVRKRIR